MRSQRPEEERLEDEANLALRAELSLLQQATATIATCIGETGEHLKTLNGSRGDLVGALRELNASERLDVECLKMELPPEVEATTIPSGEGSGELSAAGDVVCVAEGSSERGSWLLPPSPPPSSAGRRQVRCFVTLLK